MYSSVTVVPPSNKTYAPESLLWLLVMMNVLKCHRCASYAIRHYSDALVHLPSLGGTTVTLKYMNHYQDTLQGHLVTYFIIKKHYSHTYVYLPSLDHTTVGLKCMYLLKAARRYHLSTHTLTRIHYSYDWEHASSLGGTTVTLEYIYRH